MSNATRNDPRMDQVRYNLRMAIARKGTNMQEVSEAIGLHRNAISTFMRGASNPAYSTLLRICDELDVPIGLMHKPDSISESRIKLYRVIDQLPSHLVETALQEARRINRERLAQDADQPPLDP